jgi:hypothetical protein
MESNHKKGCKSALKKKKKSLPRDYKKTPLFRSNDIESEQDIDNGVHIHHIQITPPITIDIYTKQTKFTIYLFFQPPRNPFVNTSGTSSVATA